MARHDRRVGWLWPADDDHVDLLRSRDRVDAARALDELVWRSGCADAGNRAIGTDERPRSRLWQGWLEMAGIPGLVPDCGPTYGDSTLTCLAAAAGQGVALAPRSLIDADVAAAC
jgi:DNA-binding transcriptional LysR family regulator